MNALQRYRRTIALALTGLPTRTKRIIGLAVDVLVLALTTAAVIWLRGGTDQIPADSLWHLAIIAPICVIVVFSLSGIYNVVVRFFDIDGLFRVLMAVIGSAAAIAIAMSLLGELKLVWRLLFTCTVDAILVLVALRLVGGRFLTVAKATRGRERVVVYGAGRAGRQLVSALARGEQFRPVAFVDDRRELHGRAVLGLKIYPADQLDKLRNKLLFERVLVAMPSARRSRRKQILETLEQLSLKVLVMPVVDDIASGMKRVDDLREVQIEDLLGREPVTPKTELMEAFVREQTVLITGAGGSIGSELSRKVLRHGAKQLVLLDVSEYALYSIEHELRLLAESIGAPARIIPVLGSVLDRALLDRILQKDRVDTIYHAAAYKHVPLVEENVMSAVANNVLGTLNLMQAAMAAGVHHVVLVSTDKAVRPTSVMGATKRVAELIVQALSTEAPHMRCSSVRFGNVLGSSGSVVPLFSEQIRRGGPVTVTHPHVTRYFMTIREAAELVIQAGAMGEHGEIFLLEMGEPVRIVDLAKRMIRLSGLSIKDEANPEGEVEISYTGLRPGEKLYEELLIGDRSEPTGHSRIWLTREASLPWLQLYKELQKIRQATAVGDADAVRAVLAELVTGYVAYSNRQGQQVASVTNLVPGKIRSS